MRFALPLAVALGACLGAVVTAPYVAHTTLHSPLPLAGAWSPCYPTAASAALPSSFEAWDAQMQAQTGVIPDLPSIDRIPVGLEQGAWIMPGCVAIEGPFGDVTLWKRTGYEGQTWFPHPAQERLRAKEADQAALRSEIDARVAAHRRGIDTPTP